MEIVEMYCDLLLARFGLITQMTELDAGIAEAVSSLIWVAPRMQTDIQVSNLYFFICLVLFLLYNWTKLLFLVLGIENYRRFIGS